MKKFPKIRPFTALAKPGACLFASAAIGLLVFGISWFFTRHYWVPPFLYNPGFLGFLSFIGSYAILHALSPYTSPAMTNDLSENLITSPACAGNPQNLYNPCNPASILNIGKSDS